ncbi:MAG: M14 family metallopeptidase [Acidobacteria bacterium]|nr:M14 family metallopeptidase [Acidobacteriota bacterium]
MFLALMIAVLSVQTPAPPAPEAIELAPGSRYDARIPTLQQVVGHDYGDAISSPTEIVAYLKALAAAAPDRARLVEYGRTWEGRPLVMLIVGSPERLSRLDAIKAGFRQLADPRSLAPADAERLVRELPVIVWLIHAVHGNELSSSEAAMAEAYHLLAAQGDARVATVLRDAVVLIDPLQNPDGRARFIAGNEQGRALEPDSEPASVEHDEPWPGGRSNHYLFDMNRDWLGQSQVETQARARVELEWHPQVVVDLHEMGGNSTYYFAPPAEPANPYVTARQRDWLRTFGKENARRFDARGFAFFAREVFDAFYPGYGDSWPMFQGAIAMTFEQASARGLVYRRDDDTLLTYREGVVHHFTAALATVETAASSRETMLRDYLDYRRTAVTDGEKAAVREYLVAPGADPTRAQAFGRKLVEHGIEVRRLEEPIKVGTRTMPAGTLAIAAAQPSFRLLRNLMEPDIKMDETFLKEQERRRQKRLGDQIYDVTAWSLPLLFDVDVVTSAVPVTARAAALLADGPHGSQALPPAKAAYLLPWGSETAAAVIEAVQSGVRINTGGEPFTIAGRRYDVGTAIVRVAENPPDALIRLGGIVSRHGVEVVPLDSTWVDDGMSLGSNQVTVVRKPKVVLLWDSPAQSDSAGWARFVLERRFGQPVTAVRAESLRRLDLRRYNVLVLPSGTYGAAFPEEELRRLRDWISGGGVLVTLADASRWAAGDKVGLLGTTTLMRDGQPAGADKDKDKDKDKDAKKPAPDTAKPFDYEKAIQPESELPESVPGAVMRVTIDREHWLAAGFDDEIQAVVEGPRVFSPIKLDKGRNVGVYAKKDRIVAAGFAWPPSIDLLSQKAFLVDQPIGRGHVIAFAEDPNFRAVAEATELLFINAVLLGPSR